MALSTYAELQASVADWIDRDDLETQIPDFIALAEAEFNRTLFIPEREQVSTASVSGPSLALPIDYWGMRALYLDTDPRVSLEQIALADLRDRPVTTGKPQNFALAAAEILFSPAPDSDYAVVLNYWQTIPPLSDDAPTNWLLAAYPDLYLYNALLKGSAFAIDTEQVGAWQTMLGIAYSQAQRAGIDKLAGGAPLRILRALQSSEEKNMANNLSNYAEIAVLDWLMGGATPTRPTTRYLALFTAAPSDSGGGTEVSTGGYARQTLTCGAAASGACSNSGVVNFTASGAAYGLVTHVGIFDAVTTGNLLWHGSMTASKQVDDGDTLSFAAAALTFALD